MLGGIEKIATFATNIIYATVSVTDMPGKP